MKLREETAAIKLQISYSIFNNRCQAEITLLIPASDGNILNVFRNSEVSVFGDSLTENWGLWFTQNGDYREAKDTVCAENFAELKVEVDNIICQTIQSIDYIVNTYNSKMEKLPEPCEISKKFTYKVIDADA